MRISRTYGMPILALVIGLLLGVGASAQQEGSTAPGDDVKQLQQDVAALKAEINQLRAELGKLKAAQGKPQQQAPPPDTTVYPIDLEGAPIRGPKDAKVTIVEYVDFQCPFCARELPVIKQIMEAYPNDVRWVFKHFPLSFHAKAKPAHAAAALAFKQKGEAAFWQMHDLILQDLKKIEVTDLRTHAESLGLDLAEFDAVMADPAKIDTLLDKDMKGAKQYNVTGTPTVFINGLKLTPRGLDNYKQRIDSILKGPSMPNMPKGEAPAAQ